MAIQRISPLERHFDKLLFGGLGLVALGVVIWQVAGTTTTVKSGSKGEVPVAEAFRDLEQKATQIASQLKSEEIKLPDEMVAAASSDASPFATALKRPTIRGTELAFSPAPIVIAGISELKVTTGTSAPLAAPKLPAPEKPTAAAYMATAEKADVQAVLAMNSAAAKYFPSAEPYDMSFISVEAEVDGAAVRAALELDPDGAAGPIPALPRPWWSGVQLVNVELVRETRAADGSFGEATTISHLPGRAFVMDELNGPFDRARLQELEKRVAIEAMSDEIARPAFYRNATLAGRVVGAEWVPPSETAADDESNVNSQRIAVGKRLTRELDVRDNTNRRIAALRRVGDPSPRPNVGPDGGGGRGSPSGGRSGDGGGAQPASSQSQLQIAELEAKLKKVEDNIRKFEDALKKIGGQTAKVEPKKIASEEQSLSSVLRSGKVRVWAHDITAERNKTYRYAVRLKITNPLFGRGGNLAEDAKAFAATPVMTTPQSPWSEPMVVQEPTYAFFTSATAGDSGRGTALSRPSATAEVFMFTWGHWRSGRSTVEIGDALSTKVEVPDVSKLADAGNPAGTPVAPARPPGGGKGTGGGLQGIDGGDAGAPAGIGPGNPGGQPAGPAPATVPTKQIVITKDVVLLDVNSSVEIAAGAGQQSVPQAVVRTTDGTVQVRIPSRELVDRLYRRMKESADDAANRMKLPADGAASAPGVRPADPDERPPTPPPPGGRGGG